jgi:hypothetical protein
VLRNARLLLRCGHANESAWGADCNGRLASCIVVSDLAGRASTTPEPQLRGGATAVAGAVPETCSACASAAIVTLMRKQPGTCFEGHIEAHVADFLRFVWELHMCANESALPRSFV